MKIYAFIIPVLLVATSVLTSSCQKEQTAETGGTESQDTDIDLVQAREIVENLGKQFSEYFRNGDSLALAAMYAKDGTFGSVKGEDIISTWGNSIKNAIKNGTPYLEFTTNSLFSDGQYLIEVGTAKSKDNDNDVKSSGKYLVVWKQENGEWKIYRDIGL